MDHQALRASLLSFAILGGACDSGAGSGVVGLGADSARPARGAELRAIGQAVGDPTFTGTATYTPIDPDDDGIADTLVVDLEVAAPTPGTYTVRAILTKNGAVIANRPEYLSATTTQATLTVTDAGAGPYVVSLPFSGEQIFRSAVDGPYDVQAFIIGFADPAPPFTTPAFSHGEFGEYDARLDAATELAVDEDGDGRWEYIEVTPSAIVRVEGDFTISAGLSNDQGSVVVASSVAHLAPGGPVPALRLPGQNIRRAGRDGPFHVVLALSGAGTSPERLGLDTAAYQAAGFAVLLETDGTVLDRGIDTNGNGLFESLQLSAAVDLTRVGAYALCGRLHAGATVIGAMRVVTVAGGPQSVTFEFSGPELYAQGVSGDGSYQLEIVVLDASTSAELDRTTLSGATAAYLHSDFEPSDAPPAEIELTGETSDHGVDLDGDGIYDELHVTLGLTLAQAGYYHWSARLFASTGTDLGFSALAGSLPRGAASIELVFSGATISAAGVDGPYLVRALLIHCDPDPPGTPSLYAVDVAVTRSYSATQFGQANHAPVASAGPNQSLATTSAAGVTVMLDGRQSTDPDGDPLTHVWSGAFGVATGATARVLIPPGTSVVTLTVDDGRGGTASDTVTIVVSCLCDCVESRSCYSGPAGTLGIGACHGGTQACVGGQWGECLGEVVPVQELCDNGVDDDCDGLLDAAEGHACAVARKAARATGCVQGADTGGAALGMLLLVALAVRSLSTVRAGRREGRPPTS